MKIVTSKKELSEELSQIRKVGKSIGFVPTMGALHDGHLSLIEYSNKDNDISIVSIFVNPTQFNDKNDYIKYPRIVEEDVDKLKKVKCDILFTPSEKEMYPDEDKREFDFGNLDKVMEGAHRPGHFRGVALIVSKLFETVKPDKAYFGEKDFQQLAIIKKLTSQLKFNIEIVSCPIVREKDGLAMSSRNMLLSKEQRANVSIISKTLFAAKEKQKSMTVSETKDWVIRTINENSFLKVEYFEIVDMTSLEPITGWNQKAEKVGCVAVHVGTIRLIDNIRFYS
ncbi:MAG TPA: pantoate--beta-alanine ligase [Bacteroidales bacterium]|jgi:pantoate--beta-alanine ligase|nr:pantoate--beta-alanine ligase [Bacteroidales bacterium]